VFNAASQGVFAGRLLGPRSAKSVAVHTEICERKAKVSDIGKFGVIVVSCLINSFLIFLRKQRA
jgi:hypothetical protein